LVNDFFKKEGVTAEAVHIMFSKKARSQKKVLAHAGENFFKKQLQPGGQLQPLFNSIEAKINYCIKVGKFVFQHGFLDYGKHQDHLAVVVLS